MQRQEIMKEIHKEVSILQKILKVPNKEFQLLEHFISNNRFHRIEDIKEIDRVEFTIAFLTCKKNALTFSEIESAVKSSGNLITEAEENKIVDIVSLSSLLNRLTHPIGRKNAEMLLKEKKRVLKKEGVELDAIITLVCDDVEEFARITCLNKAIKEIKEEYDENIEYYRREELIPGLKLSKKESTRCAKEDICEAYNIPKIREAFAEIEEYYQKIKREQRMKVRSLQKQLGTYQKIENLLNTDQIDRIVLLEKELLEVQNKNLLMKILNYIEDENRKKYQGFFEEYQELSGTKGIEYKEVLRKYQIHYDTLTKRQKKVVLTYNKEDLEEILKILKGIGFENEEILEILEISEKEIIIAIHESIKNGVLSSEFVSENHEVFKKEKDSTASYFQFEQNCKIIQTFGLNPRLFSKIQQIYFMESELLKRNLQSLAKENLLVVAKTALDPSFIQDSMLEEKIDLLLELGYENLLEKSLDILNIDQKRILRLFVLKSLNINIDTKEELFKVLASNKFMICDEEVENYIWNVVPYRESLDEIKQIEKTREDNFALDELDSTVRTYRVENLYFSKNKVRKNLDLVENLDLSEEGRCFYALIHDSILTEEEFEIVRKKVYGASNEKVK